MGLGSLVITSIACTAMVAVFAAVALVTSVCQLPRSGGTSRPWPSVSAGLSIAVSSIVNFLLLNGDLWLVGIYGDPSEVAYYGAASRMTALILIPLTIANFVVPPVIASLYAKQEMARLEYMLRVVASVCGIPALIVLAAVFVGAEFILSVAFDEQYAAGGNVLRVLCIASMVNVATGACGQVMLMTGHHNSLMLIASIAISIGIVLATAVGPRFGALGIASAACAVNVVSNLVVWQWVRVNTGLSTHMKLPSRHDIATFVTILRRRE